jgi:hypothetical protein
MKSEPRTPRANARARAPRIEPPGGCRSLRRGTRRRPHSLATSTCPPVTCARPMATAPASNRPIAHAAAGRPRRFRRHGLRVVGRPSPPRASSIRGVQPPTRPRHPRPTHRPRATDRLARRPRALKPRHRAAAVCVSPDDRHTPVPHLPEARDHQPRRALVRPLGTHTVAGTVRNAKSAPMPACVASAGKAGREDFTPPGPQKTNSRRSQRHPSRTRGSTRNFCGSLPRIRLG